MHGMGSQGRIEHIKKLKWLKTNLKCFLLDHQLLRTHTEDSGDRSVQEISDPDVMGALAVKLPLPPGFMTTLFHHDERFINAYMSEFPGYYNTGDIGYFDKDGYVYVTSRAEDEIKIAGHRISTGRLEEVSVTALIECLFS